jgi:hypothetical protein
MSIVKPLAINAMWIACATLFVACACQQPVETYVSSGMAHEPTAPDWVKGNIPQSETEVYFVGRSTGHDVLDERVAYDQAMAHAQAQFSAYVGNRTNMNEGFGDNRDGTKSLASSDCSHNHLGGYLYCFHCDSDHNHGAQHGNTSSGTAACNNLASLRPRNEHWERWSTNTTRNLHRNLADCLDVRYKCWVLVSVEKSEIARLRMPPPAKPAPCCAKCSGHKFSVKAH